MKKLSRFAKLALTLATVATLSGVTVIGLVGCKDDDTPPNGAVQTQPVKVTVDKSTGGNVTTDSESYVVGDNVQLTITPDTGYELDSVKVGDVDKTHLVRNGLLTLEEVSEDITVKVAFKARTASTVSYNIIGNKGGTASLSASSGYVGDRVTLTVTPENGYEVMTVKVNGGENLANSLVGNSVSFELTSATVEIEIEFYAFPVKATLNFNEEGGTVTITEPKDVYNLGDTIELTVTPKTAWLLQSLTVNGEDKKGDLVEGKLTLTVEKVGNINIAAKFDAIPAHAEFEINAIKYGNEYDLNGATVELKHENGRKYKDITVTDGKITADVIPGKYKISIQDFTSCEITVEPSGYTTAVSTMYQPFKDSAAWNVSNAASGTVTINSDYGHLYLKEDLGDFIATYKIKKMGAGNRMSLGVKYGDKIMGFSSDLSVDNPGVWLPNSKDCNNNPWGNANYISNAPNDWFGFTDAEQAAYKGNGIEITIARSGSRLYMFFGERYVSSWELFNTTESVALAFTGWFPVGHNLPVTISAVEKDIAALVGSTVTATAQNGTATLDKTDGKYSLGETVTVTLEAKEAQANEKYVLESLTLDGKPVDLNKVVDGVFTFTATKKTHTVSATFKAVAMANINVAITAEKFGETQTLQTVTLSNANYNKTHTLDNGNLVVEGLAEGTYTISAEGYIPVEITVAASGSSQTAKLIYNPFNSSENWNVTATDGNIKINSGVEHSHLYLTEDMGGDFAFTINIKNIATTAERRTAFTVKYGNNKMLTFTNVWNNDYGMSIPAGDWNIIWSGASHTYNDWITLDFTAEEKSAYNGADGVNVKFVRQGTTLYVFFNNRFVNSYTLFEVDEKVECALTGWSLFDDNNNRFQIPVTAEIDAETIAGYVSSVVTATATNGTATLDGEVTSKTYKVGETVTVTITADTHQDTNKRYVLDTLKVDGKEIDPDDINSGVYTFTATKGTHTVVATFKEVSVVNLNVAVTAEKFGALQDITKVILSGANYAETEIDLRDESGVKKLIISGLADDTYKISIEGYIPITVTSATQSVKLIYQPFVNVDSWNVSEYGNGKLTNTEFGHLVMKDEFDSFAFTIKLKKQPNRTSVNVKFGDKMIGFSNDGNSAGLWLPGDSWGNFPWGNVTYQSVNPDWYANESFNGAYGADGVTYKFVKSGDALYLFVEDTFVASWTIAGNATIGLTGWGSGELAVSFSTDASEIAGYVSSIVTASATNGAATLDGGETSKTYKLGERVNVTLTPATATDASKKYVLESLTVDGNSVDLNNVVDGAYSFTATKKNHAVVATFKEVDLTISLNIAVTAERYGVAQEITSVTLSNNAGYNQTHTLTGNSLQVSGLENATYTISVDGYIPVTVTSETQSVKLVYDLFKHKDGWTISSDNGTATLSTSGYNYIELKDSHTGNFVISGTFKHPQMDTNKWGESSAFVLKVGGKVCAFQLVGSVIKTMGDFEGISHIGNAATWDQYTLTEAQQNKYRDGTLTFTIVREGKNLHLFLDDTFCKTMDFSDFDNNAEVEIIIAKWDATADEAIPVSLWTDSAKVQEWVNKKPVSAS